MADIRFTAKQYIDAGWQVVPLVKGEKRASSKWQKTIYTPAEFKAEDGIAGKCGEPSGWRVDVDLDHPFAVAAAKELLPNTGLIHGRPGKPDSHYWYLCQGAKTSVWKDVKDPSDQTATLCEIRSTGGYTVLPPSGHPSGDVLTWSIERDPLTISFDDLTAAVRNVAIATILAIHWPGPGARHHMVGHLAGFLCRYGVDPMFVSRIVAIAATIAKDPDVHDRVVFAKGTVAKWQADKDSQLSGGPKLAEAIGDDVVARLRSWLGVKDEDVLERMNQKHFWVRLGKDDVIGREDDQHVVFQRVRALYSEYANQKIKVGEGKKGEPKFQPLFQAWLEWSHRRSYRKVVFSPPPLVCSPDDYNLWKGFAIEPVPGDCPLFLEHLRDVICSGDIEHYRYLLKLLAYTVQFPGLPSEVAVVLRGDAGTGKGTFVRAMSQIFGRHSTHLDKVDQLVGHFNGQLSGKVIVFADEAFWAGDKREVGALKRLITEPTLSIERKGIDVSEETNHVHLFMATNEDWAIPAMLRERRFFALHVSTARQGDLKYFEKLDQELRSGGLAAFLHALLQLPVTAEEVRAVPLTEELRVQQNQSLSPELKWWQECLTDGEIGTEPFPDWIEFNRIYRIYQEWLKGHAGRVLDKVEFGRRMSLYFSAEKPKPHRFANGVAKGYHLHTLDDARKYFDAKTGTTVDWPDSGSTTSTIPF